MGHDIGAAVAALARVLAEEGDIGNMHKNAAGALMHHAAKSPERTAQVREAVRSAGLTPSSKPTARLLEKLEAVE